MAELLMIEQYLYCSFFSGRHLYPLATSQS